MDNLIFITCFIILSFLTAVSMLVTALIFGYKKADKIKQKSYECGIIPNESRLTFNIKYYKYIVLFLIFDVISVLLFPIFATGIEYSKSHWVTILVFLFLNLVVLFKSKEFV